MRRSGAAPDAARMAYSALLAVGACAGFAGCTGSLFQSKAAPPAVYMLSANLGTAAAAPAIPADLAVLRPRVRPGLESDRVAVLYPDRRLDYLADVRWSGPLDQVVQDLALRAFDTGARLRTVSTDSSAFTSGYWLEIEIADFQAEYSTAVSAPTIHVRLLARVGGAGDRRIVGSFDASARETASENRVSAIVDAYERAVDAALAQIVASTSRALTDRR